MQNSHALTAACAKHAAHNDYFQLLYDYASFLQLVQVKCSSFHQPTRHYNGSYSFLIHQLIADIIHTSPCIRSLTTHSFNSTNIINAEAKYVYHSHAESGKVTTPSTSASCVTTTHLLHC